MYDFVPAATAAITLLAIAYFLLEFQFTGIMDRLAASAASIFKR